MRKVVTDDDGSEWSFEVFDGNRVDAKPVKQTSPTTCKETHPFTLNDFSTKVIVSGMPSENHQTSVTKHAKETRIKSTLRVHETSNSSLPGSREKVRFSMKPQFSNPRKPIQFTRDASSGSSSLKSSSGKPTEESALPVYSFMEGKNAPALVYTKSESEANRLVRTLKGPLGFDLEWRVMWHPGAQERRTALVQLCDHETILLIQVSSMKRFPRKVIEVIESANVVKTGANILNDGEKLFRDFGICSRGLVELGAMATRADDAFSSIYNREIVSLAKMVTMYLGRALLKGKVRTSNWEADLTHKMIEYAANDCHCALMVYDRLEQIASQAGKTLDVSIYSRHVDPRTLPRRPEVPSKSSSSIPDYCIPEPPRPQQLRAYKLWHVDKMPLEKMCTMLRAGGRIEPLKESTVISYVIGALQADPRLPFDMVELKSLVLMEASSRQRHRQWIASREQRTSS